MNPFFQNYKEDIFQTLKLNLQKHTMTLLHMKTVSVKKIKEVKR